MSDWREELMATLRDNGCRPTGGLHPRETLDLLVAAWLLHRRFRLRPPEGFLRLTQEFGVDGLRARRAAWRWHRVVSYRPAGPVPEDSLPTMIRWGPVLGVRTIAAGAWAVTAERGRGLLLSPARLALIPPELRAPDGAFPTGPASAAAVVHFPFLPWKGPVPAVAHLWRVIGILRTAYPWSYERLTGLPAGEMGVVGRRRREGAAWRLLVTLRERGFDPEAYRSAMRQTAYSGNREGSEELIRCHPSNWILPGEEDFLTELLRLVWEWEEARPA